ncbi:MAG: biotin--[acetyl-CoA-carboxylase] ligase [Clostridia bacterium]|nr:biotin--[acetyl-CoA-carboxylase] ligase [Clostridia bacterium]
MKTKDAVLKLLKDRAGDSVSGQEIASILGISRNAVWKAVNSLRLSGCNIDGGTNRGYALISIGGKPKLKNIRKGMHGEDADIFIFDSVTSTNDIALDMLRDGARHGTSIVAHSQTRGRGRTGRSFFSPAGSGIYLSIIIRRNIEVDNLLAVTPAAAVATRRAIADVCGKQCLIKWVNDLYFNDRKVCGILTQSLTDLDGKISGIVVGIGVNFVAVPLPEDIKNKAGALFDLPPDIDRDGLIGAIISRFLSITDSLGDRTFMDEYRAHSMILGERITYERGGIEYFGIATDIDNDGALYVKSDSGQVTKINSGEVSIRRLY